MLIKLNYEDFSNFLEDSVKEYCKLKGLELIDCQADLFIEYADDMVQDYDDIVIYYSLKDDDCHNARIAKKLGREVEHSIIFTLKHLQYNFDEEVMYAFYEHSQSCHCDLFDSMEFIEFLSKRSRDKKDANN